MSDTFIECVLEREGGSKIHLGTRLYHFKPGADGAHVAKVNDQEHIDRFLSIPEGYRLYRPGNRSVKSELPTSLTGSSVHPDTFDVGGGKTVTLSEVVEGAQSASGLSVDEWNDLSEDERHAYIDNTLDSIASSVAAAPKTKK